MGVAEAAASLYASKKKINPPMWNPRGGCSLLSASLRQTGVAAEVPLTRRLRGD